MDYEKLCSILLDDVFSNSPVNTLIEYPDVRPPVYACLSQYEWERIRWGYWTPAYVVCISVWSYTALDFRLDNDRMMTLLEDRYPARIPCDDTRVIVGNYLRNRDDLRALKRSRAVSCSLFSRIEDQTITRGALASAVARQRIHALSRAFLEGYQASPWMRRDIGMATDMGADIISRLFHKGASTKVTDGLFHTAMAFADMILDCGECKRDDKSVDVVTMLAGLLEESYTDLRTDIVTSATEGVAIEEDTLSLHEVHSETKQNPSLDISREQALAVFHERYRPSLVRCFEITDTLPDPPDTPPEHRDFDDSFGECWFVHFALTYDDPSIWDERLVAISKSTGQIVYDNSASNEG